MRVQRVHNGVFLPCYHHSSKIQCAFYSSRWSTVNNLLTFPSKGKHMSQKAVRRPGPSVQISCTQLRMVILIKSIFVKSFASSAPMFEKSWKYLKSTWLFYLLICTQPVHISYLHFTKLFFLNVSNLVFIEELLHRTRLYLAKQINC